jgi:N-methylhydantoinase A
VDIQRLIHNFVAEHERTYGHGSLEDPVDVVSIRIVARVERGPEAVTLLHEGTEESDSMIGTREAYFGPDVGLVEVPIVSRSALADTDRQGPLFIDEYDSTTVVPPGCRATLDTAGSICIDVY